MDEVNTEIDSSIPEMEQLERFRAAHPAQRHTHQGVVWEYIDAGSGVETILILPGLLGVAEMSFQQVSALEETYRVIVPGYPASIKTIAGLVEGIGSILDAAGVQRVHVLGGSYGGLLAQRLVRRFPERVDRLILSHTGVPEPQRAGRNRRLVFMLRLLPMSWLRKMVGQAARKSLEEAPQVIPFWEAYTDEVLGHTTKADLLARYQVAADFDATSVFSPQDLKDWPGKIMLLEGDNDPVADEVDRRALKDLYPRAASHTFQGSGHIASIAKIDEYIGVIKNFLSS
jgi:pimeloyl-ACP methyl ester carboxylesterase